MSDEAKVCSAFHCERAVSLLALPICPSIHGLMTYSTAKCLGGHINIFGVAINRLQVVVAKPREYPKLPFKETHDSRHALRPADRRQRKILENVLKLSRLCFESLKWVRACPQPWRHPTPWCLKTLSSRPAGGRQPSDGITRCGKVAKRGQNFDDGDIGIR